MQGADRPSDRALLVALNAAAGVGRAAICKLGLELASWRSGVESGSERALAAGFSISLDSLLAALACRAGATAALAAEERAAERLGARLVTRLEADYPERLRELGLPPPVLAVAGSFAFAATAPAGATAEPPRPAHPSLSPQPPLPAEPPLPTQSPVPTQSPLPAQPGTAPIATVAIVGSRKATPYGLEVAAWLGRELARQGVVVVSGFAKGIDAAAHQGALAAEHGRTVAVLGCGLSCDYPKGHRELGRRIRSRGALVSEFPCRFPPMAGNFPIRNRIIAALADITVVVEAAARSGSLITARLALELGREVLAVPGRITDEQALGVNDLLRDGAAPLTHPADILERLGCSPEAGGPVAAATAGAPPPGLPPAQAALFAALEPGRDLAVDSLALAGGIGIEVAVAALLEMELAGWAVRGAGGGYRRGAP